MDTFNYLTVMVSIILGLGLTQLFGGIGNLLQVRQRVTSYWLHRLWVLILIVAHVHIWWSFWALRATAAWTYASFLYVLIGPAGLVIASHIIIPGEFYDEVYQGRFDLKRHYYDISHLFFGVFAGVVAWAIFLEPALGLRPLFVRFRLLQAIGLVAIGSCAVSKNRVLHAIAVFVAIFLLASVILLIRFRAGGFDFH